MQQLRHRKLAALAGGAGAVYEGKVIGGPEQQQM